MNRVTTTTIVDEMQQLIDEVKKDKKLDIEKRVKLVTRLTDRQLRAGTLNLQWARAISRLPENAGTMIPALNAPDATAKKI